MYRKVLDVVVCWPVFWNERIIYLKTYGAYLEAVGLYIMNFFPVIVACFTKWDVSDKY